MADLHAIPTPRDMNLQLSQLAAWLRTPCVGNAQIDGISTDSRTVQPGDLFIALAGEKYDAHDFLDQVAERGAAAVLAQRVPDGFALPHIVLPDSRLAMGRIARDWRLHFNLPVVGVTGSNGKTTVTAMIAAILAQGFGEHYLATHGNFNNDIGVPLTLFRLRANHKAAVVEMGMNHVGEIAYLANLAQPTVALVNNAQREHLEFMRDVSNVAQENGSVIGSLPPYGVAVFPGDEEFTPLWRRMAQQANVRVLTFGLTEQCDIYCQYLANGFGNNMSVVCKQSGRAQQFSLNLPLAGEHNVRNALAAIACGMAVGIDLPRIAAALAGFEAVKGRLQCKQAANGATVIDDTYNANPDSVQAALQVLARAATPKILVLGDMGEVGDAGPQFHTEAGQLARQLGIDYLFCLGAASRHTSDAFGSGAQHFTELNRLLVQLGNITTPGSTVLVKGSRFMRMERVVQYLQQPVLPAEPGADGAAAAAGGSSDSLLPGAN
jgi:UDP-N-acetylmuramoyl-tripeptide--D-alanyl-D-alanine ligase